MIRKWQKQLCLWLCLLLLVVMTGCGTKEKATEKQSDNEDFYTFTDSTGRQVELPKNIEKVASGGPLANIMLYALKPETIIGWSSAPGDFAKKYMDEKYWDLPEYGKFYGNSEDFNREALMKSAPEVVIDVGEWDEEYKKQLDELQEQLGIPVILIETDMDKNAAAFRTLGKLLNAEKRGKELAAYCEEVLKDTEGKVKSIPKEDRKTIFYADSTTGLSTILSGTIHAQVFELAGADLVATTDNAELQQGGGSVSMEQLMAWDPDVIIFPQEGIYDEVADDASWGALKAIRNGTYYEVPVEPYGWLGRPPGSNRMIGIKWLGNLLYPEVFESDMKEDVKEFYSLFYRYDLTDKEADSLLENSSIKQE